MAQSKPVQKNKTTMESWGFGRLPEGYSSDVISLFEGLNQSRGTWSFKGKTTNGKTTSSVEGSLSVRGNPRAGMIPIWEMELNWPADNPKQTTAYIIMASPEKNGFDLRLIQMGPLDPSAKKQAPEIRRAMFKGVWDLKKRTVTWTQSELPSGLNGKAEGKDSAKQNQAFEMVVSADGKITLQKNKHMFEGQLVEGKAGVRTSKASAESATISGKHRFKRASDVLDRRIKPWIPPQATDIILLSERNGHYARYKVKEEHFMKFLDELWAADKGKSAHKREEMEDGSPGNPANIANRLKIVAKEPLGNFKVYHGPSKQSSAMTTYFYDRKAGIVYQDRGYW